MAAQPHPYWQHQFLHTANLPTTDSTLGFLGAWSFRQNAGNCNHNPLDLSVAEAGATRCSRLPNGRHARNYTDTASAAQAFADQLTVAAYPDLHRALASGDPWSYADTLGVSRDLEKWGSDRFRVYYLNAENVAGVGTVKAKRPQSKNVGGAWSHFMRTLAQDGHRTIVELHKATAELNRIERRLRRA